MAAFNIDPPPATEDVAVLRAYINELYEKLCVLAYNIDEENFSTEFNERLNGGK